MPTTRPRHFVTETDELAIALDEAARLWPGLSRSQLVTRLALRGADEARRKLDDELAQRRDTIRRLSGSLTGAYPADYLDDVREGWST